MFDVPLSDRATSTWDVDLPVDDEPWNVGLIVGPSGSGKTLLADHVWPSHGSRHAWSDDRALVDDFPAAMGVKDVVGVLTSVGLGSPPAWIRPYRTLSNGEAFRASIARSLADGNDVTVVDEFTSVVDRQVAKIVSHAVQKTVRRSRRRFVAITCHRDVADWLQPDWVYDTADGSFTRRTVQPRPGIELRIHRVDRSAWSVFARHHYLSGDINSSAQCFGGFIGGELVAFSAYIHLPHPVAKNIKIGHRTVVLPDYQGLGISGRMAEFIGQTLYEQGFRYRRVLTHPAVIRYCAMSPRWHEDEQKSRTSVDRWHGSGSVQDVTIIKKFADPRKLATRAFEYVPPITERGNDMPLTYVTTKDIPLGQLHPFPGNANVGNVGMIRESLRANGQYRSLIVRDVDGTLIVLAGNHTMMGMTEEGWLTGRCEVYTCDDATAARINIADNRIPEFSHRDDDALSVILRSLDDLTGTGFDADDAIVRRLLAEPVTADDFTPPDTDTLTAQPRLDRTNTRECPDCGYRWYLDATGSAVPVDGDDG